MSHLWRTNWSMPKVYKKEIVVVDTTTHLTYIGVLVKVEENSISLKDVVIFDNTKIRVSLEEYLIECATVGVSPSRKELWMNRDKVISISRLRDISIPGEAGAGG